MTLRRLIYKNNLRQENNGAVCSMMFEIPEGFDCIIDNQDIGK